ncbi:MAG: DUF1254 domain-containing protein [Verrucomicrobia bacterium]|nr:DUF1254 domain-containing protein [Verrucomicrobiota bacterium]
MQTHRPATKLRSILKPVLPTIAALAVLATSARPALAQSSDWHEEYAYTLGVQAYIYYFPWLNMAQYRWQWVTQPPASISTPSAPLNQFWHATVLMDASYRGGGSPNTDTLYSWAWIDLTREPVILSVPAITNRYFTFQLSSMDSDNFGYVGLRTTGNAGGNYAILGPHWYGTLPAGVSAGTPGNDLRSRTPYAIITGRTLVNGTNDLTNVYQLQAQYKLTPLSYWGTTNVPPVNTNVFQPYDTNQYPLAEWMTINRAVTENPPNVPSQQGLVDWFADIGVGPGQDVTQMDTNTLAGLQRAARDAYALLVDDISSRGDSKMINGWAYPAPSIGRAGQYDDFLTRAAIQSLYGIVGNDPAESVYLGANTDVDGQYLVGTNRYTIQFPPNRLPDVGAFWSMTMYDTLTHNLVPNSLNRYKLGSLSSPPLATNADGSVTLYLQADNPGPTKESTWLPRPACWNCWKKTTSQRPTSATSASAIFRVYSTP